MFEKFTYDSEFELDEAKLCRRLHIAGDSFSDQSSRDSIPALREIAKEIMNVKTLYIIGHHDFTTTISEVDECETQIICACYASKEIVEKIAKMGKEGDYLESYLLNDLANDVLFHATNQMNRCINEQMKKEGKNLTEKFFPGEGLSLRKQRVLFQLLKEHAQIELEMNSSNMLIPEKAMLYAYGADSKNPELSVEHDCSKCPNIRCFFREAGENKSFCPR